MEMVGEQLWSSTVLGIALVVLGAGVFLLARFLLRAAPRLQPVAESAPQPAIPLEIESHGEAVLLILSGGRVAYLNQPAREWFNILEEGANLENLARRTRPGESFLSLCAAEGQVKFSLDGRLVEGTSYFVPYESDQALLVSLRRPQRTGELRGLPQLWSTSGQSSDQTVNISNKLSEIATATLAIAASLDLEPTVTTILEGVDRLIPCDISEITLWEADGETGATLDRLSPYRMVGLPGVDRRLELIAEHYTPDQGYTGYLVTHRTPLLISDVDSFQEARPAVDRRQIPLRSYLGVPLWVGCDGRTEHDLIGTLELGSFTRDAFNQIDLEVLEILAGHAAAGLHNARLYQVERQRVKELAGLANLALSTSALSDSKDLFAHLTESLAPLLDVEILGFLIYDENRRMLIGQVPFVGISNKIIDWYKVTIAPVSPAEQIWETAETIVSAKGPEDERLRTLGLDHLARAAGIRHTALVPLAAGGRKLGYLQAANKRDGFPFDNDDLRLLAIIAGQVAPIIENSTLMQESRRRAQRAETLRRIASLTGSAATLEEVLKYSLVDLARLLQADIAAIILLDENRDELRPHINSLFGLSAEVANRLGHIPTGDPQFPLTVTGSQRQFVSGNLEEDTRLLALYRPLVDHLKVLSVIDVPLIARDRGIGELVLGSFKPDFFTRGDALTSATAAGQLAAAIEQAALSSQTDQNLRKRVDQLTTLTRVSREINSTLDLETLLQRVFDEVLQTTHADCGRILLFDPEKSTPSGPKQIFIHLGDSPDSALDSTEKIVLQDGESLIIDDFDNLQGKPESRTFAYERRNLRLRRATRPHDDVRSALVVPIAYQGEIAGLIHLHAKAPNRFDDTAREIGETLAIQAAIALGNAQRYQEQVRRKELLNQRVETLSRLFETSQALQMDQPLDELLETIAYAIQSVTPFNIVLISVFEAASNSLHRLSSAGIPLNILAELRAHPQPWDSLLDVLKPEYSLGRCYFIPHEQRPDLPKEIHTVTLLTPDSPGLDEKHWHPEDILILPLFSSTGQPLGLVSVDDPRHNLRPDEAALDALEIFGSQAALAIENQQKMQALHEQVETIQDELGRMQQAAQTSQLQVPALLQKDREQTLAIQRLQQRARRFNAGLEIAEIVTRQATRTDVLTALGREMMERMELNAVLIAEPGAASGQSPVPRLAYALGDLPAGANPEALLGQRNPLRISLQTGKALLVANLNDAREWLNSPLLNALGTKGFICLPISSQNNGDLGATGDCAATLDCTVLAISRSPLAPFTVEDEQLFGLLSRQVSTALQRLVLIDETDRRLREVNLLLEFSRQLGSLDPASILHALVDSALSALPTAQAGLVAVWDGNRNLLIPQFASGYPNNARLLEISFRPGEALPGQAFSQGQALRTDEIDLAWHYNLPPENLLRYRDATAGRPPVSCMLIPIIGTRANVVGTTQPAPLGVLVLDNFSIPAAFTADDQALITSLAQQTALTLENAGLYQASEQRARQLQALTGVAATITSSLQPDDLIAKLLNQLEAILPYDTGTLWLLQQSRPSGGGGGGRSMVVRAARGFADSEQRLGLSVAVADSALLNEMIHTVKPISVADIRSDLRFSSLAEIDTNHQKRLSWLGVPLIASGEVTGVIALEKTEPNFYTAEHIQLATTFAGQAAVGLANAGLYQEAVQHTQDLDQRSRRLAMLNRLSVELSGSLDSAHILEFSIKELPQAVNCSSVSAVLFTPSGQAILQAEYPPTGLVLPAPLPDAPIFERLRQTLGIFNTGDIHLESELAPLADFLERRATRSLLIIPLTTGSDENSGPDASQSSVRSLTNVAISEHRLHGLLLAHTDHPYRFDADEVELARTLSNQVAIALQNARLFTQTRSLTQDLERRVSERTTELGREHQRTQTLLRIITELSASLDLDQVLSRTLRVLSESVDAEQITILIIRPGEKYLHRLASVGYTAPAASGGQPTPFSTNQGLAGWVISHRQPALIDDVMKDPRWIKLPNTPEPFHRSGMAVPLMVGAEALGSLLLFHTTPSHFSNDQLELVQAVANQVAVAVNNAELYRLIRDQAEDLGSMLRSQQVETSRSKAILEAVADGVLVTDANLEITLFNASAENIFNLDRTQVIGLPLDQFGEIFGPAAQAWMETIQTWTQDPESYQSGDSYAEQFTLENGRVISVHLAPVSLRTGPSPAEDFLGTVSIFQDITHQVEVDRLKSEFVATVSHELRTPMTSIKGYVEILLMGAAGALSSQQAQFLDIVKANTERLSTLVTDLLDISGIESGRIALSMRPINLNELAAEAIADLSRRIQEGDKRIKIEKDWPADLPFILGDFDRVREIFDNLLDNAYKYNLPNGRISLHMRAAGDEVQIDVQDTGMGIPDREQPRLFERFYRGDSPLVLNVAGTGLGLSIVKSLVEMHGGRIWLASTGVHGEGSTFSFTLSVVPPKGNDAVEKVTRVAEQSPEPGYQASSFILQP